MQIDDRGDCRFCLSGKQMIWGNKQAAVLGRGGPGRGNKCKGLEARRRRACSRDCAAGSLSLLKNTHVFCAY